jgi:hypothetical protein
MTPSGIEPATSRFNQPRHRVPPTLIALLSKTFRPALRPIQPPVQGVPGFFPGLERPGREVDHATPSSAEDKNERRYTSTPPYAFIAHTQTNSCIRFIRHKCMNSEINTYLITCIETTTLRAMTCLGGVVHNELLYDP